MSTAFKRFQDEPTPKHAIELAIADHKAGTTIDYDYIGCLLKARSICDHRDQLIASLSEAQSWLRDDRRIAELAKAKVAVDALDRILFRIHTVLTQDL